LTNEKLRNLARRLRRRELPGRAVVLHPITVNGSADEDSEWARMATRYFSRDAVDRKKVLDWVEDVGADIRNEVVGDVRVKEVFLDLPTPPKFQELQRLTYIKFEGAHSKGADSVMELEKVFPITSALNSYAQQCKYRMYLFAWTDQRLQAAASAYKVLKRRGLQLNKEAFRLAKLDPDRVAELAKEAIPERELRRT
jgi:hypothetical protein